MASLHEAGKENSLVDRLSCAKGVRGNIKLGGGGGGALANHQASITQNIGRKNIPGRGRGEKIHCGHSPALCIDCGFGHTTIFHQK